MKRIHTPSTSLMCSFLILFGIILLSISSCSINVQNTVSTNSSLSNQIIGTWQYANLKDSTVVTNYFGNGVSRRKIITPGSFVVVDFIPHAKNMRAAFMGSYSIENGVYQESVEYTGNGYEKYLNEKNTFEIKINGDFMTIKSINNNYGLELWKRL